MSSRHTATQQGTSLDVLLQHMVSVSGLHLLPIVGGTKIPTTRAWQHLPPLSVNEALEWLARGGNVSSNVGLARLVIIDSENTAATEVLRAAGLTPAVIPAKAQVPGGVKYGGCHVYLRLPDDVPSHLLRSVTGIRLPGGGVLDVLAGGDDGDQARHAVTVGSRLDEAPGRWYSPVPGGPLDPAAGVDIPLCPDWLLDPDVPAPTPETAALVAELVRRSRPRPQRPRDAASDELSELLDGITWDDWIDGDNRLVPTGEVDTCGCGIYHWHRGEHQKSATLHDLGCPQYPPIAHVWSGTMMSDLGLVSESVTRLQLAARLHDISEAEAAARHGVRLGGLPYTPITPDDLDERADELDAAGEHARAARAREAAANWRGQQQPLLPVNGHGHNGVDLASAVVAGVPGPVTIPLPVSNGDSDGHGDSHGDGDGDGDEVVRAVRAVKDRARAALLSATEPELLDEIFCTPLLADIREEARSAMESPMVKLMADLSAILAMIPPTVTLPPIVRGPASLNFMHCFVGRSGAGKSGAVEPTFVLDGATGPGTIAGVAPHLPATISVGSGEAIASLFATVETDKDGTQTVNVHTENARLYWPEITKIVGVRARQGSTIGAELCQLWSGEQLGSKTKYGPCFLGPHTYRATVTIGAQLATVGLLYDPDSAVTGLAQRLWLVSAELTELPEEGTPEYEALMDAVYEPTPRPLRLPTWRPGHVTVDPRVRRRVRELRYRMSTAAETDELELETHLALMRLKLALAAAIRHGEPPEVTWEWWQWTGTLLEHHRRVRRAGLIAAEVTATAAASKAGRLDAVRAEARESGQHSRAVEATLRWAKRTKMFTMHDAAAAAKSGSYRRLAIPDIIAELISSGTLAEEIVHVTNHGDVIRYRVV